MSIILFKRKSKLKLIEHKYNVDVNAHDIVSP